MIEIIATSYRRGADNAMIEFELGEQPRPVYINPFFVVAIKPTATISDYLDIMMIDGMVYRVHGSNENLIRLSRTTKTAHNIMQRFLDATTDIRFTDTDLPEEATGA